jgi:hypothetical protein
MARVCAPCIARCEQKVCRSIRTISPVVQTVAPIRPMIVMIVSGVVGIVVARVQIEHVPSLPVCAGPCALAVKVMGLRRRARDAGRDRPGSGTGGAGREVEHDRARRRFQPREYWSATPHWRRGAGDQSRAGTDTSPPSRYQARLARFLARSALRYSSAQSTRSRLHIKNVLQTRAEYLVRLRQADNEDPDRNPGI